MLLLIPKKNGAYPGDIYGCVFLSHGQSNNNNHRKLTPFFKSITLAKKKIKTRQKQPPTQTSGTETVQKKKSPYNPWPSTGTSQSEKYAQLWRVLFLKEERWLRVQNREPRKQSLELQRITYREEDWTQQNFSSSLTLMCFLFFSFLHRNVSYSYLLPVLALYIGCVSEDNLSL